MMVEVACNVSKPIVSTLHSQLEKLNEDEVFKVWCPVCKEGLLLVSRNQRTFRLKRSDRCTMCGQVVWYLDDSIGDEPLPDDKEPPTVEEFDPAGCIHWGR